MSYRVYLQKKITKKLREFFFNINYTFLNAVPKKITEAKGLKILIYHGVCDSQPYLFNSRYLTTKQFEEHLQLIKKCYHPVSFNDVISGNLSNEKLNVLLTFDDGLKNNYTHAYPLLKKYSIPAVFFVTGRATETISYLFNDITDIVPMLAENDVEIDGQLFYKKKLFLNYRFVNKDGLQLAHYYHKASNVIRYAVLQQLLTKVSATELKKYSVYNELMSTEEIKEIALEPGYTIGAHGLHHTDLSAITKEELDHELKSISHYLQLISNKQVECIAFPYGDYNQNVVDVCEKYDIKYLFRTEKNVPVITKSLLYERFTVNPFVSGINQMYYIAKNNYE